MTSEREPLWSDIAIGIEASEATDELDGGPYAYHVISQLLVKMRDDYEARIAELERELAQRWEPVNEKFILTHDTGLVDTPKQFVRWNADDESVIVGKDDGSFYHCPLPDDIRLCRLVERAEVQPYSHRNGETEPPMKEGWYWFRGNVTSSYRGEVPYSGSVTILESTYENRGLCVISTDESPSSNIEKWQGQWYGPIVAPWEDCHE